MDALFSLRDDAICGKLCKENDKKNRSKRVSLVLLLLFICENAAELLSWGGKEPLACLYQCSPRLKWTSAILNQFYSLKHVINVYIKKHFMNI